MKFFLKEEQEKKKKKHIRKIRIDEEITKECQKKTGKYRDTYLLNFYLIPN